MFQSSIPERLRKIGLVGYWPLANNSAIDLKSGLAPYAPIDLTNNGTATRNTGPSNNLPNAAAFASASSQYLSVADRVDFNPSRGMQVAGWVYFESESGNRSIFAQYDAGNNQRSWWLREDVSNHLFTFVTAQTGVGSGLVTLTASGFGAISTGTWYFLSAYFDPRKGVVGIRVNRTAPTELAQASLADSTGTLTFAGRSGGADFLDGRLSNWGMWNRRLTDQEHFWLYNNGQGRNLARGV